MINQKVIEIIANHLGLPAEEISLEDDLYQDLNAQKMAVTDILSSLEEEFKIEIPAEEKTKVQTVEDLINLVSSSYEFS